MKILSIETSCDETGISLLEIKNNTFKILANKLSSQAKIHAPFGGVYPMLAKREHIKNLPILFKKIQKIYKGEFDLIAVTTGPGLEPALWTGIIFAKELAQKYKIPIMPVNHMEGHIFSVFTKNKGKFKIKKPVFPVLSLLISGGHTELVLIKNFGKYKVIGETVDDAVGEAFDKVARMMSLSYPGGPEISKLAEQERSAKNLRTFAQAGEPSKAIFQKKNMRGEQIFSAPLFSLPRPMIYTKDFNFSFSGLKTAVLYLIRDLKKENENILENIEIKKNIALEFENAITETLVHKTKKAIEKYNINTLLVAGGVSANKHLKKELQKMSKEKKVLSLFPEKNLTGDNAMMIAIAGYFKYIQKGKKGVSLSNIKADGNMKL